MVEIHSGDFEIEEPRRPEPSLRDRLFPTRGFSAVEVLLLANLLVGIALMALWRGAYGLELAGAMRRWHEAIRGPLDAWRMFPTLFIHAGFGHLARNMIALVAAGAVVEIFYGSRRALLAYLVTGFSGAVFSYLGHSRPPLSVGASGAIFGLAGVTASFLIRYYRRFTERQKWKARRVYGPLFLVLVAPSLFQADYFAHLGGFMTGILLGVVLPLDREGQKHLHPADVFPELTILEGGEGRRPGQDFAGEAESPDRPDSGGEAGGPDPPPDSGSEKREND